MFPYMCDCIGQSVSRGLVNNRSHHYTNISPWIIRSATLALLATTLFIWNTTARAPTRTVVVIIGSLTSRGELQSECLLTLLVAVRVSGDTSYIGVSTCV